MFDTCYATKKFNDSEKISKEQLNTLKEAFNLTALSYGLQTLKMVVVEDKIKREKLVGMSYGQRQVADASHLLVTIRNTPDAILSPFKAQLQSSINEMTVTKKVDWATRQAYIALGNLMTVCAVEGIDSCPMEGFVPKELDAALGLDKLGLTSVLLLPVGFRAEDDMFSGFKKVRKSISKTVIEL